MNNIDINNLNWPQLLEEINKIPQISEIINKISNMTVHDVFKLFNITEFHDPIMAILNQTDELTIIIENITRLIGDVHKLGEILSEYSNMTQVQVYSGLLNIDNEVNHCLIYLILQQQQENSNWTIPNPCEKYMNESNFNMTIDELKRENLKIDTILLNLRNIFDDFSLFINKISTQLAKLDLIKLFNQIFHTIKNVINNFDENKYDD
jgi:hypothetical protein